MLGGGIYPGMITATVGTVLLLAVVGRPRDRAPPAALRVVVRGAPARVRGIALAWFHQIPTGNELVLDTIAADYWRAPIRRDDRRCSSSSVSPRRRSPRFGYRLRVAAVVRRGRRRRLAADQGRGLDRLHARAGQFFLWRFLTRGRWWKAHPFSLSAAPDGAFAARSR